MRGRGKLAEGAAQLLGIVGVAVEVVVQQGAKFHRGENGLAGFRFMGKSTRFQGCGDGHP